MFRRSYGYVYEDSTTEGHWKLLFSQEFMLQLLLIRNALWDYHQKVSTSPLGLVVFYPVDNWHWRSSSKVRIVRCQLRILLTNSKRSSSIQECIPLPLSKAQRPYLCAAFSLHFVSKHQLEEPGAKLNILACYLEQLLKAGHSDIPCQQPIYYRVIHLKLWF